MTVNLSGAVLVLLLDLLIMTPANQADNWAWNKATRWVKHSPVLTNYSELNLAVGWGNGACVLDLSYHNITRLRRSDIPHRNLCATELNLKHNGIQEIDEAAFAGLQTLEELYLSSNHLQLVTARTWLGLERLKLLDLRDNRLAALPRFAFSGLIGLQKVFLQNNRFTSIPGAVQGMARLQVLSLARNQITIVDRGSLQNCLALKELYLEHNLISEVSAEAFQSTDNLKVLNLSSNLLQAVPAPTIQALWERGAAMHLYGNPWRCSCDLLELWRQRPGGTVDEVGRCRVKELHGCGLPLELSGIMESLLHEDMALTLPCGSGGSTGHVIYWQTPFGRWEKNAQNSRAPLELLSDGSLKIGQATPQHTGLYYCLLQQDKRQGLHSYRVQYVPSDHTEVRLRKRREATNDRDPVTESQFAAAVASSVIITFLGGFSLGAFSRTYLSRCFQRATGKHTDKMSTKKTCAVPMRYRRSAFWKDAAEKAEDRVEVEDNPPQNTSPHQMAPPMKASRSRTKEGEQDPQCTGADPAESRRRPNMQDIHTEKMDSEESSQRSFSISDAEDQEASGEQMNDGTEKPQEPDPRPKPLPRLAKRRVIKLYQYDEDGNPYGHTGGEEADNVPSLKQRSLSLTRLSAIMSAATGPSLTEPSPEGEEAEEQRSGDSNPVFELSV